MKNSEKVSITVKVFFEVLDAEVYGGVGSIGYTATKISGGIGMAAIDFDSYIKEQVTGLSKLMGVPEENIRIIDKTEYELNTEEE